ncbi:MAG: sulfide/dihydroorotate dehydrogenase-like FAD/NAD-binding protein [Syntrophobacterales bacterium]|nr:sulfide/dihydroorotate dehydrogenase-like FAD/NAD-binding protein [Syntrophobacterales bacterium]
MYPIIEKEAFSETTKKMVVEAPHVARKAKPGQFVIVQIDEKGERIPLTIADFDRKAGTITLIFQEIGKSTRELGMLKVGEALLTVAGPLGHPTEIAYYGTVICVGGGVGIAPIFPIARALKEAQNEVISIIGARTKSLLFWEDRMREVSDELIICTDDGSYGRKAIVTTPLKEILDIKGNLISKIWAIGPAIMMKAVSEVTASYGIPTMVSLNTVMVDGTGMCGGCRVLLEEGPRFVCVDGPEFDGHKVDWSNLLARLAFYREEEKKALEHWEEHECHLDNMLKAEDRRN